MVAPIADFVVSIGSNGQILSQGTIADALALNRELKQEVAKEGEMEAKAEGEIDATTAVDTRKEADGKLIVEEEVADGHISFSSGESIGSLFLCHSANSLSSSCNVYLGVRREISERLLDRILQCHFFRMLR